MSSAELVGLYAVIGALTTGELRYGWYEAHGDGDPLVLLHPGGAGVDARALAPNVGRLVGEFCVYTPERRAHGHTPDVAGPITFDAMARDTIAFLETVVGRRAHVVGCSDGAIVGLLVALRRPDLIDRLVLVAGVFHFTGWLPQVIDPNTEPPEFLARLYARSRRMAPVTITWWWTSWPGCIASSLPFRLMISAR